MRALSKVSFGFTLLETLFTLGIASTVAAIGLGSGIDSYERAVSRNASAAIVWNILQARAEAMNGVCEGTSCIAGTSQGVNVDTSHHVVFDSLSGVVDTPQSVVFQDYSSTSTLSVSSEGQVSLIH